MKTKLLIIVMLVMFNKVNGQWVQTNGPEGGTILSMTTDGTNVIAGTFFGGIYLSANNGTSWTPVNNGLNVNNGGQWNGSVYAMASSGQSLFAGTSNGIFKSNNVGNFWTQVAFFFNYTISLAASGNYVVAGTQGNGIYFSPDNGNTWRLLIMDCLPLRM